MTPRRSAALLSLAAALAGAACTRAVPAHAPVPALGGPLATALADDARLDFAGITGDTLRWRLRLAVAGFAADDSSRLARQVTTLLPGRLDASAPRELYLEADPPVIRGDTARVEARVGARWRCGATATGSFVARRYDFVRRGGAWELAGRVPLGHGDAAPCRD